MNRRDDAIFMIGVAAGLDMAQLALDGLVGKEFKGVATVKSLKIDKAAILASIPPFNQDIVEKSGKFCRTCDGFGRGNRLMGNHFFGCAGGFNLCPTCHGRGTTEAAT